MKMLASATLISLFALLPLASSHAAPSAAASSVSGQVTINWGSQHSGHYGHYRPSSRHHRDARHQYHNPAVRLRQHGTHRHTRSVNGYQAAYRQPCEYVTVRSYDHRGRPYSESYKRCFDARGYGFEVPGSRVILR